MDGGTLSNVDLVLKPGATLRIINGGILETRNSFEAPVGAIVDIQYGQILWKNNKVGRIKLLSFFENN